MHGPRIVKLAVQGLPAPVGSADSAPVAITIACAHILWFLSFCLCEFLEVFCQPLCAVSAFHEAISNGASAFAIDHPLASCMFSLVHAFL